MYHTARTHNFQFDLFDPVTLDDLELKCDHQKLRMVLIGAPDTIYVDLLHFSFYKVIFNIKVWQIVKHFGFGLTCGVVGHPEVNDIMLSPIDFPGLSNAV